MPLTVCKKLSPRPVGTCIARRHLIAFSLQLSDDSVADAIVSSACYLEEVSMLPTTKPLVVPVAFLFILSLALVSLFAQQQTDPSRTTEHVLWEFDSGG
jgi:hypothetical protein